MTAPDKYDEAIAYLTEHPDEIVNEWWNGSATGSNEGQAGCLFNRAGDELADGRWCGCLTQVRGENLPAATPELTAAIRADHRIPADENHITVDHLEVFAEWQRKIDAMNLEASS